MADWNDNAREDLEPITDAIAEILREVPDNIVFGLVTAGCSVFYLPALVMGHARRGLRDLREEFKKWQAQEDTK